MQGHRDLDNIVPKGMMIVRVGFYDPTIHLLYTYVLVAHRDSIVEVANPYDVAKTWCQDNFPLPLYIRWLYTYS
jgi:hypothetical protein